MAKKITFITDSNFPEAMKYARSLNRKMAVSIPAQNIVLPLGSILFAIHTFILLLNLAQVIAAENGGSIAILASFPFISNYCVIVWDKFGLITQNIYLRVFMFAILFYLLPSIVCAIVRLMISIFIRGKKPTLEGNAAQKAKQLYSFVAQAPLHKRDSSDAQKIWCRITGIPIIACFTAIVSYVLFTSPTSGVTELWPYIVLALIMIVEAILVYLCYARLYSLLTVFIKPYYDRRKEWEKLKDETKRYWLSIDPDEQKKRDESSSKSYDGWKYRNLENTQYYKDKYNEYYAQYMGLPYETDEDKAKRQVREIEDELSGGGWGDY